MVQYRERETTSEARRLIDRLREMGITEDLLAPVMQAAEEAERNLTLMTIPEAAELRGIKYATVHGWVRRGRIMTRGYKKAAVHGGKQPLIALEDVDYLIANPLPEGRPPKFTAN